MINVIESSRNNPTTFVCSKCGKPVYMCIHHDYIEGMCCNITYAITLKSHLWNCCSKPSNGCGFECKKGEEFERLCGR
jgi:hypothetical protein